MIVFKNSKTIIYNRCNTECSIYILLYLGYLKKLLILINLSLILLTTNFQITIDAIYSNVYVDLLLFLVQKDTKSKKTFSIFDFDTSAFLKNYPLNK